MNTSEMAALVVEARRTGTQCTLPLPEPIPNRSDAMDIQAEVFDQFGSPSIGWKVGATTKVAQQGFGIDSPFYGPMAEAGVIENGGTIEKTPCIGACEPEYAFKLARDYPASGEAINAETAAAAVESVHAAIEVIGRCIGNAEYANGVGVTMDFGGNAAFVVGPEVSDWQNQDLTNAVVESKVDGEVVQTGNGEPIMGDPINSLVWMAQTLADAGKQIKAGEWVSTGTCTPAVPAEAGKTYTARFSDFGEVSVKFV